MIDFNLMQELMDLNVFSVTCERLGMCCHQVFPKSSLAMCSNKKGISGETMATLLSGILGDLVGEKQDTGPQGSEAPLAPYVVSEVPVSKVQGVRAKKSCTFLQEPQTISQTVSAVLSTEAVQALSAWLLKAQRTKAWLSKIPEERPVVNLATMRFSPAAQAICDLIKGMEMDTDTGIADVLFLFDGRSIFLFDVLPRLCTVCVCVSLL